MCLQHSAGGNFAAVVAQQLKGRTGRALDFQILIYPCTNMNFATESCKVFAAGFGLTMEYMEWYGITFLSHYASRSSFWRLRACVHRFRNHYLNDESEINDLRASPDLATDLSGLPACLTLVASHDVLRDESEAYAAR